MLIILLPIDHFNSITMKTIQLHHVGNDLKVLKFAPGVKSRLVIPTQDGYEIIKVQEITYIKASSNYSYIYLTSGRSLLCSKTIKCLQEQLTGISFLRSHHSYLVNTEYVKSINRKGSLHFVMDSGEAVPISQSKKQSVINYFLENG